MNEMDISDKINKIIKEIFEINNEIKVEDNLVLWGLDSMSAIKLIICLEEEFEFEIIDEDLQIENFDTISKIKQYVISRLSIKNVNVSDLLIRQVPKKEYKKIAIVTGANRGIGYGIARVLYENGYKVIALNRTIIDVEWCEEKKCDLKRDEDIIRAIVEIAYEYGHIDILVNNAGIRRFARIDKMSDVDWEESFRTNVTAPLKLIQKAAKCLAKANGLIIFIGSSAAEFPIEGGVAYSCSKAALQTMAEVAIRDLRYEGIRVSCISLGAVELENKDNVDENEWKIQPNDIGELIVRLAELPLRIMPAYVDLRPSKPKRAKALGLERLQYL